MVNKIYDTIEFEGGNPDPLFCANLLTAPLRTLANGKVYCAKIDANGNVTRLELAKKTSNYVVRFFALLLTLALLPLVLLGVVIKSSVNKDEKISRVWEKIRIKSSLEVSQGGKENCSLFQVNLSKEILAYQPKPFDENKEVKAIGEDQLVDLKEKSLTDALTQHAITAFNDVKGESLEVEKGLAQVVAIATDRSALAAKSAITFDSSKAPKLIATMKKLAQCLRLIVFYFNRKEVTKKQKREILKELSATSEGCPTGSYQNARKHCKMLRSFLSGTKSDQQAEEAEVRDKIFSISQQFKMGIFQSYCDIKAAEWDREENPDKSTFKARTNPYQMHLVTELCKNQEIGPVLGLDTVGAEEDVAAEIFPVYAEKARDTQKYLNIFYESYTYRNLFSEIKMRLNENPENMSTIVTYLYRLELENEIEDEGTYVKEKDACVGTIAVGYEVTDAGVNALMQKFGLLLTPMPDR